MYGDVEPDARADEKDVLLQTASISVILEELGYRVTRIPVTLCLDRVVEALRECEPFVAFNLVESIGNKGHYIVFIPSILDELGIPYTGCGSEAIMLTSNKLIAKDIMSVHDIPTPSWVPLTKDIDIDALFDPPYIIKSVWEHASIGLDDHSVFFSKEDLQKRLASLDFNPAFYPWFIEAYMDGREINISIIQDSSAPRILEPAEILFTGYPEGKPKIVGYCSKWEETSYEYQNTRRSFEFSSDDESMIADVKAICRRCWRLFSLRGYARIDFRIDENNRPWVLEINANPCLTQDSGFVAALHRSGLTINKFVERTIAYAVLR